jgi:hypothetical protein
MYTSVPIEDCPNLPSSIHVISNDIVKLVEVCLRSTFFVYQGEMLEQVQGAAMCSPQSPVIANLFMEDIEERAIEGV